MVGLQSNSLGIWKFMTDEVGDQIRYCMREFEHVEYAMSITLDMSDAGQHGQRLLVGRDRAGSGFADGETSAIATNT